MPPSMPGAARSLAGVPFGSLSVTLLPNSATNFPPPPCRSCRGGPTRPRWPSDRRPLPQGCHGWADRRSGAAASAAAAEAAVGASPGEAEADPLEDSPPRWWAGNDPPAFLDGCSDQQRQSRLLLRRPARSKGRPAWFSYCGAFDRNDELFGYWPIAWVFGGSKRGQARGSPVTGSSNIGSGSDAADLASFRSRVEFHTLRRITTDSYARGCGR